MEYRIERDSMGEVRVPADRYWGAQTQRSHENFPIGVGIETMPMEIIRAFAVLKKAAAISAYFSAARMRPHLPAPKQAERMGWAAWPTLYAQHWTMVLTFTITPYTASASVPSPCRIWRLNSMVRMPMAMSMKKVEKPVTRMARSFWGRRLGHRKRSVFFGDRK